MVTTSEYISSPDDGILVTGSNGFIGAKVVEILLEYGFSKVRCFVRSSSQLHRLEKALNGFNGSKNVEFVTGDLLSREDCERAAEGVSIIYHLDRKSTRLNSSHSQISYAVFCLKKKK